MQKAASQLDLFSGSSVSTRPDADVTQGVTVRESARARRLSIKVYPRGKIEVVVPRRTRPDEVASFVSENRAWIERALASFANTIDDATNELPRILELPAIGRRYVVVYRPRRQAKSVSYRETGGTLVLTGAVQDEQKCVFALRRWLGKLAKRELEPTLRACATTCELPFTKLQVRLQRTCWGSRSSTGTISINLCLLFLDAAIVRYLMIHELCHVRHMDHSAAFWSLVARYEPDYRKLDKALGEGWREVPGWLGVY